MTRIVILISILLEASTITTLPAYRTYQELMHAGYYHSPGFDCQVTLNEAEVVFSATKNESRWAIFVMEKVPSSLSSSGYRIRQIIEEQVEGERIDCRVYAEDKNRSTDLVEITRQYGGDLDSPDHLNFFMVRNIEGILEAKSCEWSYGPAEIFWDNGAVFVRYKKEDGERVTKQVQAEKGCFRGGD